MAPSAVFLVPREPRTTSGAVLGAMCRLIAALIGSSTSSPACAIGPVTMTRRGASRLPTAARCMPMSSAASPTTRTAPGSRAASSLMSAASVSFPCCARSASMMAGIAA